MSIATFVVWQTPPWRSASQLTPAADFAAGVNAQAYGEFGWRQLTAAVAIVYQRLAPEQRRTAVIVTERYIQASALDYDRNAAALPAIYSPKRGFGYFGTPPPDTAETVIWSVVPHPTCRSGSPPWCQRRRWTFGSACRWSHVTSPSGHVPIRGSRGRRYGRKNDEPLARARTVDARREARRVSDQLAVPRGGRADRRVSMALAGIRQRTGRNCRRRN